MDRFLLLRFAQLIGLMLMSAGLIGVFIADMRSRQVRDVKLGRARAEQLASFTHFLDFPILLVIVSLGALRPAGWTQFVLGVVIGVAASSLLNYAVPRLYPYGDKDASSPPAGE